MITDFEKIKTECGAQEVVLSGWDGGEITVKLRRPTLFSMAAGGHIPNPLLGAAEALFSGSAARIKTMNIADTAKVLRAIAKSALIEPEWERLEEAGIELTDVQLEEIFAFTVGGAAQLARFRDGMRRAAGQRQPADGNAPVKPDGD